MLFFSCMKAMIQAIRTPKTRITTHHLLFTSGASQIMMWSGSRPRSRPASSQTGARHLTRLTASSEAQPLATIPSTISTIRIKAPTTMFDLAACSSGPLTTITTAVMSRVAARVKGMSHSPMPKYRFTFFSIFTSSHVVGGRLPSPFPGY